MSRPASPARPAWPARLPARDGVRAFAGLLPCALAPLLAATLAAALIPQAVARPPLQPLVQALVDQPGGRRPAESALALPEQSDPALAAVLNVLEPGKLVNRSQPQSDLLKALYRDNGGRLLWLQGARPSPAAETVHARLSAASLHGLSADDYRAASIGQRLAALRDASRPPPAAEVAELDITMTLALLRYLADVRQGRSPVRQVSGEWTPAPGFPEARVLLDAATDPLQLQQLIDAAAPAYPIYGRLIRARAAYEALIAAGREAPRLGSDRKIEAGDTSVLLPAIAARLAELGDLAVSATVPARYEGELVEAVERFQGRHGLAVDGVIGRGTLAALQTPNRQRLRQIDLALERLRWLPPLTADRVIGVNIPDFRLWAYARDPQDGGRMKLALESKVVVGKQGRTPTPVFIANMTAIDFNPFWNVPPSIARSETLPRLRRDPGYLARQAMEFVGADGRTISREVSAANLAAVARGAMRIRQRPGEENALGEVKFTMPNTMNIYLHDTPSRSLFSQSRRDFSHGCIRVEKPLELARYALVDDPAWDEAAIRLAMAGDQLQVVRLRRQIPVVVFYTTATVDDDGTLRFMPDIYGHDRKLDASMPAAR